MKKITHMILSIAIITIGLLLGIFNSALFFILSAAGIILLFSTKDVSKHCKLFWKSFKPNKKFTSTLLIDAAYWFSVFALLVLARNFIEKKTQELTLKNVAQASFQAVQSNLAHIKSFIFVMILISIILLLIILLFYSITRYPIWTVLANKKITKKDFLKFLGLNLLWWLIFVPLTYFIVVGLKQPHLLIGLVLLSIIYVYLTALLHNTMIGTGSIKKSFSNAMKGFALLPKFLSAIASAIVVYFVLLGMIWIISLAIIPGMIFHGILFLFYMTWLRIYLRSVIIDVKL